MASILTRKSLEKRDSSDEKTPRSIDEEKAFDATATVSEVAESSDGDEALRLVGRERTAQFSDEYNRKLRRKLVSRVVVSRRIRRTQHDAVLNRI